MAKIKISAGSRRTLNNLLAKAEEFAFLGSAHPDAQDEIEESYKYAIQSMEKLIARLESAKK